MDKINWDRIYSFYNTLKRLYAECEETDPELKTNLQPLNEFRAALDHLMRIVAIEHLDEYKDRNMEKEAESLFSHLCRAFYDVADMLAMNYRNKIVDALKKYNSDIIAKALPDYYSVIKPRIEELSLEIAELRTSKGFGKSKEEERVETYLRIVQTLRDDWKIVNKAQKTLSDLHNKNKVRKIMLNIVLPVAAFVIGIVGLVATIVSCSG